MALRAKLSAGVAGAFAPNSPRRRWALIASGIWVVIVLTYGIGFLSVSSGTQERGTVFLDGMFFLVGLTLPTLLIWLAAWMAEELDRQRGMIAALAELTPPLLDALASTRAALEQHGPATPEDISRAVQAALRDAGVTGARGPDISKPLDRLMSTQAEIHAGLRHLLARPVAAQAAGAEGKAEPRVARPWSSVSGLAAPVAEVPTPEVAAPEVSAPRAPTPVEAEGVPVETAPEEAARGPSWADLIRALDFPRDANDHEGFAALKVALRNHSLAQMLQAAEDVLTLLSQEGVYMEDLDVVEGSAAAWRRFIAGERGAGVAEVGGIVDAQALDKARGLMKADPIFRDTALYFQRRYDVVLTEFGTEAVDAQLLELANTRSGRAFTLLARLSGSLG